jgi:branched-chain amino acid aminotransferase
VKISPLDRGFYVGDSVFEVERTFDGKSFRMKEHVDRLYRSLTYTGIDAGLAAEEMFEISEEAIARNEEHRGEVGDFTIHQFITRGEGRRAWQATDPTVCVRIGAIDFANYAQSYIDGANAAITSILSYSPQALDPKVKHYSRMNFNLAEVEANNSDPGALPILRDENGNITEGTGYNVLLVTDGAIRTADDRSLLQGVSRGTVYDMAEQLGIPVVEQELQPYDVYTADEVFFSTTSWCVLPVTRVDKRQIGDGKPGEDPGYGCHAGNARDAPATPSALRVDRREPYSGRRPGGVARAGRSAALPRPRLGRRVRLHAPSRRARYPR